MIFIAILIYILILLLMFLLKPSIMFDSNGNIKTYTSKSLITLDIIHPIIALLSYYFSLVIKIILIS
jgi:hypothetical protein